MPYHPATPRSTSKLSMTFPPIEALITIAPVDKPSNCNEVSQIVYPSTKPVLRTRVPGPISLVLILGAKDPACGKGAAICNAKLSHDADARVAIVAFSVRSDSDVKLGTMKISPLIGNDWPPAENEVAFPIVSPENENGKYVVVP
jgi:hypothetical protein